MIPRIDFLMIDPVDKGGAGLLLGRGRDHDLLHSCVWPRHMLHARLHGEICSRALQDDVHFSHLPGYL